MSGRWSLPALMLLALPVQAAEIATGRPELQGMSSDRLQRVQALNQRYTDAGIIAGIVTAVARNGVIVHQSASGVRGVDDPRPIALDDLFRIYSMSKPVTAVAAMQLYEQGAFQLSDPVSRFIPELKDLKVIENGVLRPAKREMTMHQLLTHTAGLSYGFDPGNPIDRMYVEASLWEAKDLDDFVTRLARLPLMFDPGGEWQYSVAVDVTGLVVERISGQPFDEYLNEHIFQPLDMVDTGFNVPPDERHRLLPNHVLDSGTNRSVSIDNVFEFFPQAADMFYRNCRAMCDFDDVTLYSGGSGLVSTLRDYLRFALAMRDGELDGQRILSPKTVNFMRRNHLAAGVHPVSPIERIPFASGGWGIGFSVLTDPAAQGIMASVGDYSWTGGAGTVFWIDPVEDIVVVSMMQLLGTWPSYQWELRVATNQALTVSME
ncbi:MAG: beta-lactamase family protein [Gammaproteobacteria bacterium]|nr:beta-lactamase family protein [Gammaproteobacteria bacterium]